MKFPKTLFFSAAILLGGAGFASAVNVDRNMEVLVDKQLTEDYYVTSNGTLTLNIAESHTMKGHFYGSSSLTTDGGRPQTLGRDYAQDNAGYYDINAAGGKIVITGGGTLEYQGFSDINYYSGTYLTTHGEDRGVYEQAYTKSLVGIGEDGNVDITKTAFSGQLTVSGGTKVVVSGYLSQYVTYARPIANFQVFDTPIRDELGFVGISNLVLADTSVISFASSGKNLLSEKFDLGDGDTGPEDGASGVRALNFLNNVKADVNTTIELGTDKASTTRIVIATTDVREGREFGWDGESKIGKLAGTGRVYFVDGKRPAGAVEEKCVVSIMNRAEFATLSENASAVPSLALDVANESSVLNYVHNLSASYDLTGNVRKTTDEGDELVTGVLADVFLLTDANLGSDSTGANVVDNVLETATAVQFSAYFDDSSETGQVDGALWESRGLYVDSGMQSAKEITIHGTQVMNNVQSLFFERETLYNEYLEGGEGFYELTSYFTTNNYNVVATAYQTSVFVRSGATMIINQQEDRDGLFSGRFFATDADEVEGAETNDGYIIKTGKGTFSNCTSVYAGGVDAVINRLFIYEGTWLADSGSLGAGRIYVGNAGTLRVISNRTEALNARLEGAGLSNLIFTYDSSYTDDAGVKHGGLVNDGREFLVTSTGWYYRRDSFDDINPYRGNIQVAASQENFYGTVTVDAGMTLTLGMYGNSELDSAFSNASAIELVEDARLIVQSYQILPSLVGGATSSLVFSDNAHYDAVAVLTGAGEFSGKISGNGTLVKAGTRGLSLESSAHTLATVGLSGTTDLKGEGALLSSSGVVLANASRLSSGKNQSLGALVGAPDATVSLSGGASLTVGLTAADLSKIVSGVETYYNTVGNKIANDGYFFATADADAYLGSFGLNLNAVGGFANSAAAKAIAALGAVRPDYMREDAPGVQTREAMTAQDTINYLKDPAKLANSFAHIYATIDTGTFGSIRESAIWTGLGIAEGRLDQAFNRILDLKTIREFVASKPEGWSERQLSDLLSYAESYEADPATLFVYEAETGDATLTRANYLKLLDANVIKYLAQCGSGLTQEQLKQSETLYGFISLFVDDYKFRLTDENVNTLSKLYGFSVEAIRAASTDAAKYAEFEKLIGVQYADGELPAFAGSISGAGSELKKIGSETLRLTGKNEYTGATVIQGGELRVDWDAIQKTSGVYVNAGALLTLVSEGSECIFEIASEGVISGAGTILKDGEGTLVIESALAAATDAGSDFTGEIVVGKGGLRINTGNRTAFAESVNVYLNEGTSFDLNVAAENALVFNGKISGGAPLVSDSATTLSELVKSGEGKLTLVQGAAIAHYENEYNIRVQAGTMELQFNEDCDFRGGEESFEAVLGKNATLIFAVAENTETSFAGRVLAETSGTGTTFVKDGLGTLSLSRPSATTASGWTVDTLALNAGTLSIAEGASYHFSQITTEAGTIFDVDGTLTVSGEENNVFNGQLAGTGTIEKVGNGTLVLSDILFEGSVVLKGGTLALDIGADENGVALEKTLNFNLLVEGADPAVSTSLVKQGVGTAILGKNVNLSGAEVSVKEGTLAIDGSRLADDAPASIAISKDAILKLDPAKNGFDLANVAGGLSGEGTFALGGGATTVSDGAVLAGFTGTFEVGTASVLNLGAGINSIGGIAGTGTVAFDDAEQTVTLKPNRDLVFTGTLDTAENATLVIAGNGELALSDGTANATLAAGTVVQIGSDATAGNVSVGLSNTTDVVWAANGSAFGIVGDVSGQAYAGKLTIAQGVTAVEIGLEGQIDLSQEAFGTLFSDLVREAPEDDLTVTLANRNGSDLTLDLVGANWAKAILASAEAPKPAYDFSNKGIVLATNAGGTLNLATSATAYAYAQYAGDITGDGNLEKSGAGELRLTSSTQSYTGKTLVSQGTLAFSSGTRLQTSGITVKSGAVLSGGVTLLAENASVDFENGSTYRLDVASGEALRYTGNVDIRGQVKLDIAMAQEARGKALSVFEYIGEKTATAIDRNSFSLASAGELLYIDQAELAAGNLKVYVAQNDFRDTGADLHDGINGLIDVLNGWATPVDGYLRSDLRPEEYAIADALNKTSLGELGDAINNLSPLAYASMITMPHAGFSADARAVSARLEQRLYDSNSAIWVYERDVEFFAQAQGSTVDGGSSSDSMVYDYNTYGALAGADIKFNKETTAGFAVAYDHGKASIHGNGGEIESDDIRATFFAGHLINDYLSVNAGAQIGYATYDVDRNTVIGKNKGDTDAWHGGVFADFVGAFTLTEWGDNARLDCFPHAGLALSYYRVDKFEEKSSRSDWGSSLATDAFDALSLQARLGAAVNCVFEIGEHATRIGLDLSLVHEFLDDEVEIESWISDSKFKTDARALSGTSLSLAPSVSYDLSEKTTLYFNYEFRVGTESEVAHRANLGFRHRF